jgi:hypothetical protein
MNDWHINLPVSINNSFNPESNSVKVNGAELSSELKFGLNAKTR